MPMTNEHFQWFQTAFDQLVRSMEQVIIGKHDVLRLAAVCLTAEGHFLVEDVPGTGKTSLAKALARSIDAPYARIQFTPDLLPSDVTGGSIWNQSTMEFEFRPGPVFASIVLADEINRASPKTQSALLEVMDEAAVTTDATTRPTSRPFMVIATQNPIDMDGTYRLPEAQLDRFMMKASIGYPDIETESDILESRRRTSPIDSVKPVLTGMQVEKMVAVAAASHVAPAIRQYIAQIVAATRESPELRLGASPRASVALMRSAAARAASEGRHFVLPEDVQSLAHAVLEHRLLLTPEAQLSAVTPRTVLDEVMATTPIPRVTNQP
ncbi:MAG: MoxR family ATPase [Actinobacteria bacterium]|nr:MoxR family ATPase [Actinomycetota bacterium]